MHDTLCSTIATSSKTCDCATVKRVRSALRESIETHPAITIADPFSDYEHGMYVGLRIARKIAS